MSGVDEIDNANIRLIQMLTMQATCILLKGAPFQDTGIASTKVSNAG